MLWESQLKQEKSANCTDWEDLTKHEREEKSPLGDDT